MDVRDAQALREGLFTIPFLIGLVALLVNPTWRAKWRWSGSSGASVSSRSVICVLTLLVIYCIYRLCAAFGHNYDLLAIPVLGIVFIVIVLSSAKDHRTS